MPAQPQRRPQQTARPNAAARQQRHAHAAFTLIELLVVVSIIALLISILLPSLRSAREQAKTVKCLVHARGLGQASLAFAQEHDGRMQLAAGEVGVNAADPDRSRFAYDAEGELLAWPTALAQAAGMSGFEANWRWGVRAASFADADAKRDKISDQFELAGCPADRVQLATPVWPMGTGTGMLQGTGDPDDPVPAGAGVGYWGLLSYGINEDIVGAKTYEDKPPPVFRYSASGTAQIGEQSSGAGDRLVGNMDRIYDPSTVLLFVDAGPNSENEALAGQFTIANQAGLANLVTSARCAGPLLKDFEWQWFKRIPTRRHPKGRVNVLFADYHGEPVQPVEFQMHRVAGDEIAIRHNKVVRVSPYPPFAR
ncbi:MAG TPA: prepilin-type N-terminal cleavage/methylation domain-containing protein [Phycisphaerae bacterium]|nr:prepilin-type N-terminal cleavage/methylation domain-containing protein [Phycisphaerae bacterium]